MRIWYYSIFLVVDMTDKTIQMGADEIICNLTLLSQ